jgi:signal transduction histidine kinase
MNSHHHHPQQVQIVLTTLKDITAAVIGAAESRTLDQVLNRIAHVAQQVVHCRYAALGVPDDHDSLRYFKTAGMTADEIARLDHPPIGRGLLGAVMHERHAVRVDHMADDPRSIGFPKNHPSMDRFLGVPIQVGAQLYGMLYACDRVDGEPFDENDEWLIEVLAGYAALAIAGVQISEQQSRLILLEERERVAMELHDGIIQSLYAVGMQMQLIRLDGSATDDQLLAAIQDLDTVIEDIRSYILNLRSVTYQQQTVEEGLRDVMARLHFPPTLAIHLTAPNRLPPFSAPVFEAVCQIAHEALSNVIRHANASRVEVIVTQNDQAFQMIVADNGSGFDLHDLEGHRGLGLRNLHQRALIHGGKLSLNTSPGQGTKMTLTLPALSL